MLHKVRKCPQHAVLAWCSNEHGGHWELQSDALIFNPAAGRPFSVADKLACLLALSVRRRHPTVFDLFGDAFYAGEADPAIDPATGGDDVSNRESLKSEAGGFKGLLTKFFDQHGEDGGTGNDGTIEVSQRPRRRSDRFLSARRLPMQAMLSERGAPAPCCHS